METAAPQLTTTVPHPIVSNVRTAVVSVPLPRPVAWSNVSVSSREYVLVWIDSDDGHTGFGFAVGSRFDNGGTYINSAVTDLLAPLLIGREACEIERIWEDMTFQTLLLGRRGAVMRAISAVDVALWDLLATTAGRPLCDLFGRYRSRVPAYASGGYYYSDDPDTDLAELETEVRRHVELGFQAVKIKTGRLSAARDRARIMRVLDAVGPDVKVAVDANHAWRDYPSAINDLRHLDDLGLWWIEEPVLPDQLAASARLAETLVTPVATGEIEAGRWAFQQIVDMRAADIIQADVTVVGGISEWLKIAHMAACRDVPLAPHWVADIHVHVGASTPNVMALEYFHPGVGVLNFDQLLAEKLVFEHGELVVPERPGHGIVLDPEAVNHYKIA
jgi:L-alanine-DL-glutamate epimerase-like enolase superfamily enzyme